MKTTFPNLATRATMMLLPPSLPRPRLCERRAYGVMALIVTSGRASLDSSRPGRSAADSPAPSGAAATVESARARF